MCGSGSSSWEHTVSVLAGRLCRALWTVAVLSSILSCAVAVLYTLTPLATYEGWTLSGYAGLLASDLRAFGEPARVPPLQSVSLISVILLALAASSAILASLALRLRVPSGVIRSIKPAALGLESSSRAILRALRSTEAAAASAASSSLALTLLYSLLRVVAEDVLPLLESPRSLSTSAGTLYLDPPVVHRSPLLSAYSRWGIALALWGVASALLAAALSYYRLRAEPPAAAAEARWRPG